MATLLEHVYAVKNLMSKGVGSADERYTERLITYMLNSARARLIKDKMNKYGYVSPLSYQTVCIPLELTTYHDCDCIPADLGCKVLKSTCVIPRDLISKKGSSLMVKKPSGEIINETSITANKYVQFSEANNPADIGSLVENGHIIILNNTTLQVVLLTAIWEDPNKIAKFCTCGPNGMTEIPCYDPIYDEYPIDADLSDSLVDLVVAKLKSVYQLPEDNLVNAKSVELGPDKEN